MDKTFVGDFGLGDATNMFPFTPATGGNLNSSSTIPSNTVMNPLMASQMNPIMGGNPGMNMGQYNTAYQMGNMGNMFMPPGYNNGGVPDDLTGTGGAPLDFPDEFNPQSTAAAAANMMGTPNMHLNNSMIMNNNPMMMLNGANQFNHPNGFQQMMGTNPAAMFGMMTPQQQQFFRQQQQQFAQQQMMQARMMAAQAANAQQQQIQHQQLDQVPITWQSEKADTTIRHEVINKIVAFLRNQKPNAPVDWIRRLPQMAKKLEEKLYRSAKSKDEYMNEATLKARLQVVARSFHAQRNPHTPPELAGFCQQVALITAKLPADAALEYHKNVQNMLTNQDSYKQGLVNQQQRLLLLRHAMWCRESAKCKATPQCTEMKALWGHIGLCPNMTSCPVEHCISSKFVLSHFHQCSNSQCIVCSVVRQPIEAKDANGGLIMDPHQAMHKLNSLKRSSSDINTGPAVVAPPVAVIPNIPTAQPIPGPSTIPPGSQQFATQMAMIQQKFKDWSMAQLQEHSKKLQVWAEQLKSQIQMLTVECTKQVELFRMALDPAAKVQYHSQAEELQKQLKELKAKLSRCAHQHKIMAFTINGRQTPPRHPTSFESAESMQNLLLKSTNQPNQQHIPMLETSLIQNTPVLELPVKDEHPPDKKIKLDPSPPPTSSSTTTSTTLAVKAEPSPPPPPPASSGTCMLPQMTNAEIRAHVQSLQQSHCASLTVAQLKKKLDPILKNMMEHKFGWVFSTPVDPVALGIPDYFHVIKRPMDFGTIKKKLEGNVYKHMYPFAADVRLTFGNAMTFNNEGEEVYSLASDMLKDFNCEMAKLEAEIGADEAAARAKDGACQLCGSEGLVFEPAILYCNGDCNSKIRRNNYYFCSPDNKFHCCVACHPGLPDTITKPADGGPPYIKAELCRKKNDDVHEEPWVQCDSCNQWVHQICGLFSDKEKGSEFQCPTCLLQLDNRTVADKKVWTAKSLPRSKLSDYLERRVAKVLQAEDEAMKHDKLIIRQVSNIDKTLMVRDKMYHRYKDQAKYPSEHRFKSKCICMFQEIHGVSVLLFGMYVHEFDEQEAQCNSRRVYVSYLDSVNYLEPAYLRTKLYHEILIGYLEYVKQRGFHTAHIWACPPLKGDDYILYCHPETQKTPKSDRLRHWYIQMLMKAKEEGIVVEINNMYDEYWAVAHASPTDLPYFEGDYWVGLAEELIEKLDEEGKSAKKKKDHKTKKPKHPAKKDARDDVDFHDQLMHKLGEHIHPMKDDFLVVKLFPSCAQCKRAIHHGTVWKDSKTCLCDGCYQSQMSTQSNVKETPPYVPIKLTLKEKCSDPDDVVESEIFDTRQAFLSLCQANHYQFDELRRAKHTSMLTLFHLGQLTNGYIYSCNVCKADINSGTRWHCNTCVDYDVCAKCYETKAAAVAHGHPLEAVGTVSDVAKKALEERKKSIALHMQLLVHASSCDEGGCASANCEKMKELLRHGAQCKLRATGGCGVCRRVWALLQIHARQCRGSECRVPRCNDLREHLRKLALQQQLMDDRRRAAVTEQYSRQAEDDSTSGGS